VGFFTRENKIKEEDTIFSFTKEELQSLNKIYLKENLFKFLQTGNSLIIDYTDKKNNRRDIYVDSIDKEIDFPEFDNSDFMYFIDRDDQNIKKLFFSQMHSITENKASF
jgi:hypothetical protein